MEQQLNANLSSGEARRLSAFLNGNKSPQDTLSLNALKGLAFSVCCSPQMLVPSQWLPTVFGGMMPEWEKESDLEYIELIMRLYNQVAQTVLDEKPKLPTNASLAPAVYDNFKSGHPLHDWCFGFNTGLDLTEHYWDSIPLPTDVQDAIADYWMYLSFFSEKKVAEAFAEKSGQFGDLPIEAALQTVRQQMPTILKEYAELAREVIVNMDRLADAAPSPARGDTPQSEAETLMKQAFAEPDLHAATRLVKEAIRQDPDNIEAYMFLAETAPTPKATLEWAEQAAAAGERALGTAYFSEHAGHFWGLHETRPYMQVLARLSFLYGEDNQWQAAIDVSEKLLRLNPNDNQAIRHSLVSYYLHTKAYAKAEALIRQYDDDLSAFMCFSEVLLCYIQKGDCAESRQLRKSANQYNKYVARYLSGKLKIPKEQPEFYGIGDKNEAIYFTEFNLTLWRSVLGVIPWLNKK